MRIILNDNTLINSKGTSIFEGLLELRKYFEEHWDLYKEEVEDNIEQINLLMGCEDSKEKINFHQRICFQHFTAEIYNYYN